MSDRTHHSLWLSLIDVSGPFLAEPILKEAFPQGLGGLDPAKKTMLRQAYDEWREARDLDDPLLPKIHGAWIDLVLKQGLELDEQGKADVLKPRAALPETLACTLPEHGITLRPEYAIVDAEDKPLMLVATYGADVSLTDARKGDGWAAAPAERMIELCRATQVRLGLVTNGEHWMFVDAPINAATTIANWYARLWGQEPLTLQAFVNLLGIRRFFVDRSEQLPALLDKSLEHQDEVTDALGEQVRRAVEVLIQALERADVDRKRELLEGIEPTELYEAGLTVMMRIVFLLSAEERGLLLMGDPRYEANYAVSTLRLQLRANSDEILERRQDAWSRLLSVFRAVYGGIDHDTMRLPALGGSLFDPDRFPFLEGRKQGSDWTTEPAVPLPIDNRTVLLLLEAVQLFQGRALSYLALDVEQIGYVYEGLLERSAVRAAEVTLDLAATKSADNPWVSLPELDDAGATGSKTLEDLLKERTGSAATRVRNDLGRQVDDTSSERLLAACHGDRVLRDRIKPYFHLLRTDPWGYPLVYPKGTFMVRTGSDRRETGTHYTPKALTESIVAETLEPIVYSGPAEGKPRDQWRLKTPSELLDLKICDPAMGSGAFLVQVCRWLSERVVESWQAAESQGKAITADGEVVDALVAKELLRPDAVERLLVAKRAIAERCLYGVDMNPLAVELAKLSIWLVTLAKGRPFGFLDHNFRSGDSLLGITGIEQLYKLETGHSAESQKQLFAADIDQSIAAALELRSELRRRPVRDIRDVEVLSRLNTDAREQLQQPAIVADALFGDLLSGSSDNTALSIEAGGAFAGESDKINALRSRALTGLSTDSVSPRRPFHWPLEFPEVFAASRGGFDCIIGNPPFLGNSSWKSTLGAAYSTVIETILGTKPGKIDLSVVFHRRAFSLIRDKGSYGLLAANNIAEGGSLKVGLEILIQSGEIISARRDMIWPGSASVIAAYIIFYKGRYAGRKLANGVCCQAIDAHLKSAHSAVPSWSPVRLSKRLFSFKGVDNSRGLAFVLEENAPWKDELTREENSLLRPYITGNDITTHCLRQIDRWALDIGSSGLDEIAASHPVAYQFLEEVVRPTRSRADLASYKGLYQRWWQFWNHRDKQFTRLRRQSLAIAFSRVTKHPICILVPSEWIYTEGVILIGYEASDSLAICQSSIFAEWLVATQGAKFGVGGTLRLSIGEGIDTFPLPSSPVSQAGIDASKDLDRSIKDWCEQTNSGVTDYGNALGDAENNHPLIGKCRELASTVTAEVAKAYEFNVEELELGFHDARHIVHKKESAFVLSPNSSDVIIRGLKERNKAASSANGLISQSSRPNRKLRGEGTLDMLSDVDSDNDAAGSYG